MASASRQALFLPLAHADCLAIVARGPQHAACAVSAPTEAKFLSTAETFARSRARFIGRSGAKCRSARASHEIRLPIRRLHARLRRRDELRRRIVEKDETRGKFHWPRLGGNAMFATSVFQPIRVWGVGSAALKVKAGECGMGAKEPPLAEGHTQRDEEVTVDVFEVSGSIKWFDASKGYGFIVPDEDLTRRSPARDVLAPRRLSDGLRGRARGVRGVAPAERPPGLSHSRHGRFDGDPSVAIAAANPCHRHSRRATGSGPRSNGSTACAALAFSPAARRRSTFSCTWRRSAAAASPSSGRAKRCWCAIGTRTEGADGGRAQTRRLARTVVPLTFDGISRLRPFGGARSACACAVCATRAHSPPAPARSCSRPRTGDHNFKIEVATTDQEQRARSDVSPLAAGECRHAVRLRPARSRPPCG